MQKYDFPRPVYTKEYSKDVPGRLLDHHWKRTVDFNKLPKFQLKVKMCCAKCEEKVLEEIWEVPGVFDVRAYWMENKVVVTAAVGVDEYAAVDQYAVLRKARKIDCKARFVDLDSNQKLLPLKQPPSNPKIDKNDDAGMRPQDYRPPPPEYRPPPPDYRPPPAAYGPSPPQHRLPLPDYRRPPQEGMIPFYFLFLVVLLVSMFVFRR